MGAKNGTVQRQPEQSVDACSSRATSGQGSIDPNVVSKVSGKDTTDELAQVRLRLRTSIGTIKVSGRYHQLPKRVEDDYIVDHNKRLGKGVSAAVYRGLNKVTQEAVAVKTLELHGITKEDRLFIRNELEVFLTLDHPHIVRLKDVYENEHQVTIITELLDGGDLLDRFAQLEKFSERYAAEATSQMLVALVYMHDLQVVHRDIKCDHFIFDTAHGFHLKLIDFGFSKMVSKRRKKMMQGCGTLAYMAPEVLNSSYTNKCDLWSLGVVVYVLLIGTMPFDDKNTEILMEQIMKGRYRTDQAVWAHLSSNAKHFLQSLLQVNPDRRLSAKEALEHPWVAMVAEAQVEDVTDAVDAEVVNSLREFAKASRFRRACMHMVAMSLSNEERMQAREAFLKMDTDRQGTISIFEMKRVLESKVSKSDEEVQRIFDALDKDSSGEINYSEFLSAMTASRIAMRYDLLREAFRRFDQDGSGVITVDDLREVLGEGFEDAEVEQMIREADASLDGQISLDEFISYVCGDDVQELHQDAADRLIDSYLGKNPTQTDVDPGPGQDAIQEEAQATVSKLKETPPPNEQHETSSETQIDPTKTQPVRGTCRSMMCILQ